MVKNAVKVLMTSDLSRAALLGLVTACKRERAHDNAAVNGNANADQNYPKIWPRRAQAMRERKPLEEKGRDIKYFHHDGVGDFFSQNGRGYRTLPNEFILGKYAMHR